jgi:hypothetical protein
MLHPSSDDEKTCAMLASTLTEYSVYKMAKGHYCALL